MKLADLRKLSVRQNLKIHFQLSNGLECIITEQGVARIPALSRAPDFNLEQELVSIGEFVLEPAVAAGKKTSDATRLVRREEMESLVGPNTTSAGADHEEE
jgi:hypothetical protein